MLLKFINNSHGEVSRLLVCVGDMKLPSPTPDFYSNPLLNIEDMIQHETAQNDTTLS